METRIVNPTEVIQIAAQDQPSFPIPPEGFEYVPGFKIHSYHLMKFKIGNTVRAIYVHGGMNVKEAEEAFFSIVTDVFDVFVRG